MARGGLKATRGNNSYAWTVFQTSKKKRERKRKTKPTQLRCRQSIENSCNKVYRASLPRSREPELTLEWFKWAFFLFFPPLSTAWNFHLYREQNKCCHWLPPPKKKKKSSRWGTSPLWCLKKTTKKFILLKKRKLPNSPGFWCWSPRAVPVAGACPWSRVTPKPFPPPPPPPRPGCEWLYIVACQSVHFRPKSYLHCGFGSKWQNRGTGLKNLNLCSEQLGFF